MSFRWLQHHLEEWTHINKVRATTWIEELSHESCTFPLASTSFGRVNSRPTTSSRFEYPPGLQEGTHNNKSHGLPHGLKMMYLSILLVLLINGQAIAEGHPLYTIERIITQSEDDVEMYASGCQPDGNNLDISYYSYNQEQQHILLIFRNISYGTTVSSREPKEAHVEFQAMSTADDPLSVLIRYNTIASYDSGKCDFPLEENWSNAAVTWDVNATVESTIFMTPNINQLVMENFQSQLWKDTGRLELIISPDPASIASYPTAFRQGRSYDRWVGNQDGNSVPKLVIQFEAVIYTWTDWSSWSTCQRSALCGNGNMTRSRSFTRMTMDSVLLSNGTKIETKDCGKNCSINQPQCWTNINLRGYRMYNHTSETFTVPSVSKCCRRCYEMKEYRTESCMSFTLAKQTSGSKFECQINNITKEESDESHCFKVDDKYTHYHIAV